jgi:hypothetical protein
VDTGLPFQSGKNGTRFCCQRGQSIFIELARMLQELFFCAWGSLDTESGVSHMSPVIREATERLFNIVDASTCGVFVPR